MAKEDKSRVIRKRDPSKRKNIHVTTLNKIKAFLKEQTDPVFKSEIVRHLGIDYNSVNLALTMIEFKTDEQGRIFLNKKGGKNV